MDLIDTYFQDFVKKRTKNVEEYFSEYFSEYPMLDNQQFSFVEKCSLCPELHERNIIMLSKDSFALISIEHDVEKYIVEKVFDQGFSFLIPDIRINLTDLAELFKRFYSGYVSKEHKIKQVFFGLAGYTITRSAKKLADELGLFLFSRPHTTVLSENTSSFIPRIW